MPPERFYKPRPGDTPSGKMLDDVGLDFDGDLGGLKKDPPIARPRPHAAWICLALSIPIMLIAASPGAGWMFIAGVALGVTGMLVIDAARR